MAPGFRFPLAQNLLKVAGRENCAETTMVIYMDEYRKTKALQAVVCQQRYDEELLCVNWNPAIGALAMSSYQPPEELSPELPENFSNVDVTEFLDRVYALASQI